MIHSERLADKAKSLPMTMWVVIKWSWLQKALTQGWISKSAQKEGLWKVSCCLCSSMPREQGIQKKLSFKGTPTITCWCCTSTASKRWSVRNLVDITWVAGYDLEEGDWFFIQNWPLNFFFILKINNCHLPNHVCENDPRRRHSDWPGLLKLWKLFSRFTGEALWRGPRHCSLILAANSWEVWPKKWKIPKHTFVMGTQRLSYCMPFHPHTHQTFVWSSVCGWNAPTFWPAVDCVDQKAKPSTPYCWCKHECLWSIPAQQAGEWD